LDVQDKSWTPAKTIDYLKGGYQIPNGMPSTTMTQLSTTTLRINEYSRWD